MARHHPSITARYFTPHASHAIAALVLLGAVVNVANAGPAAAASTSSSSKQSSAAKAASDDDRMTQLAKRMATSGNASPSAAKAPDSATPAAKPAEPAATTSANPIPQSAEARERLPLGRSAAADAKSSSGSPTSPGLHWIFTTLAALGAVVGLILLLRAAMLRLAGRNFAVAGNPLAEVLGRVSVGPKQTLVFIKAGRRVLLVGQTAQGLNTLADIDDPEEVASILQAAATGRSASITRGFNQILAKFHNTYEPRTADEGRDDSEHTVGKARDEMSGLAARLRVMAGEGARS